MKIDDVLTALHRISLASQNSMSSKEECGRIARVALFEWNRAEKAARAEQTDEEPEVVSYFNGGIPRHIDLRVGVRFVIESRDRVALLSWTGSGLWHLYTKKRGARSAPLGDWTFDDLTPAYRGTSSEAQATRSVVEGKW